MSRSIFGSIPLSHPTQARKSLLYFGCIFLLQVCCLVACTTPATRRKTVVPLIPSLSAYEGSQGLSSPEREALTSLQKVDPYPLYVMSYSPSRTQSVSMQAIDLDWFQDAPLRPNSQSRWGCALVSVFHDREASLFGRNFDWRYSPALLLFYQPIDGYQSVSMVDLAYFFNDADLQRLDELTLEERMPLLETYTMPFDGMNSRGLVIGMAAVPYSDLPEDPSLETVGSLALMRRILNQAEDVDAALKILTSVKPIWGGGPALHYLISDANGRSVVVEYIQGEIVVLESKKDWQVATNFLLGQSNQAHENQCWRFDKMEQALEDLSGQLSQQQLMDLLASVSQDGEGSRTQWSIVYDNSRGEISLVVGQGYSHPYRFELPMIHP